MEPADAPPPVTPSDDLPPANPHRGEVAAIIDGEARVLRLTLGGLAAMEQQLSPPSLIALLERFEKGQPMAGDVRAVIQAAHAGAGIQVSLTDVDAMRLEGGVLAAYRLASALLAAAFAPQRSAQKATE